MIEQRRFARAPIDISLTFAIKGQPEQRQGVAKDISLGGLFIETTTPANFGADVVVTVKLPGAADTFALPGVVRWVRNGGMGVQFGLLGAAPTHVITEINRKHADAAGR